MAIDVSSEPVFLSKKRRISMDVSSGLIFLTHTKKKFPELIKDFYSRFRQVNTSQA